jgi:hypothetical protein
LWRSLGRPRVRLFNFGLRCFMEGPFRKLRNSI